VLCYVTDRRSLAAEPATAKKLLLEKIEQAAAAGVDWIQLREKDLPARELADLAGEALRRIASAAALLINDRLDIACACKAAGVHLGERSLPVKEARRLAGLRCAGRDFLVGASVHSLEAAQEAERNGADYVIFGPIFATPSKETFGAPQGLTKLREVCQPVAIPVLAIGGITVETAQECLAAGAGGIAAIRLFQDAQDIKRVVARLRGEATISRFASDPD
jgi:thiamine-phosphate pyrophosphorylase